MKLTSLTASFNPCILYPRRSAIHHRRDRFVLPTVVEATFDSTVMGEEVFGPVLMIVPVPSVDEALGLVNERFTLRAEHPLILYIFSRPGEEQKKIADAVPSRMCSIKEVTKIAVNWNLPFGGLGASGMGAANGKHGFDFFSHRRGTVVSGNRSTLRPQGVLRLHHRHQ
jgi:aldehyde dehydrogenase (NAD+)